MIPMLIITAIGLACGLLIYLGFLKIPNKVQGLEKTEEINAILPGRNCAACGYPGCFGFAQALTANPQLMKSVGCGMTTQEPERLARLGQALGMTLDASAMATKAVLHCGGHSEVIYKYSGVKTCKGANQLLSGYKKCPYACLGLGDCALVCPENAISYDEEKDIVVIDWDRCSGCGLCAKECPKVLIEMVSAKTKIVLACSYLPLRPIPGRERCVFGCTHCQRCFKVCEQGAITWNKEKGFPEFDPDKCNLCLSGVEECPQQTLVVVGEKKEELVAVSSAEPTGQGHAHH